MKKPKSVWQKDIDHYMHPWTDFSTFKETGSLIVENSESVFIIDDKGKRIKSVKVNTAELKQSYTFLHRLVFNLKRLIEMLPLGKNRLASYAAALFLIKEHCELSGTQLDKEVFKYLKEGEFLPEDLLEEFSPIKKLETEKN